MATYIEFARFADSSAMTKKQAAVFISTFDEVDFYLSLIEFVEVRY